MLAFRKNSASLLTPSSRWAPGVLASFAESSCAESFTRTDTKAPLFRTMLAFAESWLDVRVTAIPPDPHSQGLSHAPLGASTQIRYRPIARAGRAKVPSD